jgi:EAL domain-containing protein (putative c-di-GMP-specific phosphodiesterase class I)
MAVHSRLLQRAFLKLAEMFAGSSNADNKGQATEAASPAAGERVEPADFSRLLQESVRRRPLDQNVGSLQVIYLDEVWQQAHTRSSSAKVRVMDLAEKIIKRRLSSTDVYSWNDSNGFIILFGALSEEKARFKARAISQEIHTVLVGETEDSHRFWVESTVARVDELTADDAETIERINRAISEKGTEANESTPDVEALLGKIRLNYRPILNMRSQMITVFAAHPSRVTSNGAMLTGAAAYPKGRAGQFVSEMDLLIMRQAIEEIKKLIATQAKCVVMVPIHYDSLTGKSQHRILDFLRKLPEHVRRYLVVEVIARPKGTPSSCLVQVISNLRNLTRTVALRASLGNEKLEHLRFVGCRIVGIDLQDASSNSFDAASSRHIERFAKSSKIYHFSSYILGINSPDLFGRAKSAGFDYINAAPIGLDAQYLKGVVGSFDTPTLMKNN